MNKQIFNINFLCRVLVLSLILGAYSCSTYEEPIDILPPDWVDPNEDDDKDDEDKQDPTSESYRFITPQVDNDGRIVVAGTPANYADTAKYHVLAVAYDLNSNSSIDLEAYYSSAVGKSGDDLRDALEAIVKKDFKPVTYGDARYVLVDADRNPVDNTKVWLSYEEKQAEAKWDNGSTWNREHVWAKSKGLGGNINNNESGAGSDIYNLKAEDPTINTTKGNRDFEEKSGDESFYGTHGTYSYVPMKSARGDVARIMFYMDLRWGTEQKMSIDNNSETGTNPRHGKLDDLINWHSKDPVDPFEIRRSNVVYSKQNNRNPFVDHPELVDYLYGDKKDVKWDGGVTYKNN